MWAKFKFTGKVKIQQNQNEWGCGNTTRSRSKPTSSIVSFYKYKHKLVPPGTLSAGLQCCLLHNRRQGRTAFSGSTRCLQGTAGKSAMQSRHSTLTLYKGSTSKMLVFAGNSNNPPNLPCHLDYPTECTSLTKPRMKSATSKRQVFNRSI